MPAVVHLSFFNQKIVSKLIFLISMVFQGISLINFWKKIQNTESRRNEWPKFLINYVKNNYNTKKITESIFQLIQKLRIQKMKMTSNMKFIHGKL